jgi:hypothetical protein
MNGSWLCENGLLGCRSCARSSRFACPRVYQLPSEGAKGMSKDEAAALLRAYGFDVRTDGLGNVAARVCSKRADGTVDYDWEPVPADSSADVMHWISTL